MRTYVGKTDEQIKALQVDPPETNQKTEDNEFFCLFPFLKTHNRPSLLHLQSHAL